MSSFRPWAATLTARLSRARDRDTVEIVEFAHGSLTRRVLGPGGPLAFPVEELDEQGARDLLDDLRAELDALPADIERADVEAFMRLLQATFPMVSAA